jgi:hypothetical protein
MFMMKKLTVGGSFVALLLLAGASMSPLRAGPVQLPYVDQGGLAYLEGSDPQGYAFFFDDYDGCWADTCGGVSPIIYKVTGLSVVEVTSTQYDLDFTAGTDVIDAVINLGTEVGAGPYYDIASITGTGEGGAVTLSEDSTPIPHGPGFYPTDNLFDPTGSLTPTIPEPSDLVLLATGLLAMALVARKRKAEGIRQATRT